MRIHPTPYVRKAGAAAKHVFGFGTRTDGLDAILFLGMGSIHFLLGSSHIFCLVEVLG